MNNLYSCVANSHEQAYCEMMNDIEAQDAKEEWIEKRADEPIKNFGNDNDWQIIELLKIKLESKSIDADIYNQFIVDICYSQAKAEYQKQ
ncbi:hypothetical protein [Gilliamella sp. B2828]|uniref:hypothetical protein n=1 Tax=Gilliamella sp. B2828 TaxID=2817974 RepID=UPI00226A1721|nr:hypothetical protein [Gilliamella sp. B2828]MCX8696530.1 hypothetical protein [Gilliamella sp. B2828]